jgi:hypothetical protein
MKLADLEVMLTDAYKKGWDDRAARGMARDKVTGKVVAPHVPDPALTPDEVTAHQVAVRDVVFKHTALIDA